MQHTKQLQLIAIGTSLVVLVAVVAGLIVVGSPSQQRMVRRDADRTQDLWSIQNYLTEYWVAKGTLPDNLSVLNDATRGVTIPSDPQTNTPYTYERVNEKDFRLCATFEKTGEGQQYDWRDDNWKHEAGYTCFDRHIDPDFYRPMDKTSAPAPVPAKPVY